MGEQRDLVAMPEDNVAEMRGRGKFLGQTGSKSKTLGWLLGRLMSSSARMGAHTEDREDLVTGAMIRLRRKKQYTATAEKTEKYGEECRGTCDALAG